MLQLHQIRNHTDGPVATDDTAVLGPTEQSRMTDLNQEDPVLQLENLSNDEKTIIYDIGKLNSPPHNGDDQSPGTIHGHQTVAACIQDIPGKALGHIQSEPALLTAAPTKKVKFILFRRNSGPRSGRRND